MEFDEFNLVLCNNLRMIRKVRGLSQSSLALQLGISRSTYSAIENGRQTISLYHAILLSEILLVDIQTFWCVDLEEKLFSHLNPG
ncbi:MAG: helix-turn-helix transcriptional regulator [Eubacterium sp.]|nr:helix-turn-helix transcriptional regulator [Eubacterium sp.]